MIFAGKTGIPCWGKFRYIFKNNEIRKLRGKPLDFSGFL